MQVQQTLWIELMAYPLNTILRYGRVGAEDVNFGWTNGKLSDPIGATVDYFIFILLIFN